MKRIVSTLMFFAVAFSLAAVPLAVTWLDGSAEAQQGSSWVSLSMGDKVDSSSTLRLGSGSSIELRGNGQRLSITAAGTYSLASLLGAAQATPGRSAAMQKLGKLVDGSVSSDQSTIAGVRGAAIEPAKDSVTWQSEDVDVTSIMDEGRALVRDEKYEDAALKFAEAAESSAGPAREGALYSEAWSYAAAGSGARAVALLRGMSSDGGWAGPRALLLARLDLDTGSKTEAGTVIKAAIDAGLYSGDDLALANSLLDEATAGM